MGCTSDRAQQRLAAPPFAQYLLVYLPTSAPVRTRTGPNGLRAQQGISHLHNVPCVAPPSCTPLTSPASHPCCTVYLYPPPGADMVFFLVSLLVQAFTSGLHMGRQWSSVGANGVSLYWWPTPKREYGRPGIKRLKTGGLVRWRGVRVSFMFCTLLLRLDVAMRVPRGHACTRTVLTLEEVAFSLVVDLVGVMGECARPYPARDKQGLARCIT